MKSARTMTKKISMTCVFAMAMTGAFLVTSAAWAGRATVRNCLPKSYTKYVTFKAYNLSGGVATQVSQKIKYNHKRQLKCDARVNNRKCKICVEYKPNGNTNKFRECQKLKGKWVFKRIKTGSTYRTVFRKGTSCS